MYHSSARKRRRNSRSSKSSTQTLFLAPFLSKRTGETCFVLSKVPGEMNDELNSHRREKLFPRQSLTRDCVRVRSHQRKQEQEGNEDDEEEHV